MGKMQATDVAWDLPSMEMGELLSEKTMVFIAKVCLSTLIGVYVRAARDLSSLPQKLQEVSLSLSLSLSRQGGEGGVRVVSRQRGEE